MISEAALLASAGPLRLGVFAALLLLLGWAQWRWPLRALGAQRWRWLRHLTLSALGTALVRLLFPMGAIAVGAWADARNVGLLQWLAAPHALQCVAGVVALDLAIYLQHRAFHQVPWLWRLHRMHHSDTEFELTTAIRFHPLEIVLSMLIKLAVILALGVPALAVLLFEILLNATALFSHANLRLPVGLDRASRRLLVTPDMHRVHHSVRPEETNSNYGFCLSVWDRWLGTLRTRPREEQIEMAIGLERFRTESEQSLWQQLQQPLR